jgi:hypothetical protein
VKSEYLGRFAIATKEYMDASPEEKEDESVTKPVALRMRTEIVMEFWKTETAEFREQMVQDAEGEHAKALEIWEQSKEAPKTAQQFHQYVVSSKYNNTPDLTQIYRQLVFAGQYLHPVAEAIALQMQAAVSICIIGPIGERNGEVEVRSVHVNWPGGVAGATWPLHDPAGYTEAEKSMCNYGRANFSQSLVLIVGYAILTLYAAAQVVKNASFVH